MTAHLVESIILSYFLYKPIPLKTPRPMEEEYFSADRILDLDIGSVVQVSREDGNLQYTVSLVGADNNRSILTTLPPKQKLPDGLAYDDVFSPGIMLEMKTIYDGRVVAFESAVIATYGERLLISSFPEMIETRRLRRDIRFPCAVSCDIRLDKKETYGVITDISHGGCLLSISRNTEYAFIEESLNNDKAISLEIFFPTAEDAAVISATVKSSVCQLDGACKVGFSFSEPYECIRKYLESLQLDSVAPFFY